MWKAERLRLLLPRLDLWFAFSDDPSGRFPDIHQRTTGHICPFIWMFLSRNLAICPPWHQSHFMRFCFPDCIMVPWILCLAVLFVPPLPSSPSALGLAVSCGYHVPSESPGSNGARFSCFGMLLPDFILLCSEESSVIYEHNAPAPDIFLFSSLFPYFVDMLIAIKSCTCAPRVSLLFSTGIVYFFQEFFGVYRIAKKNWIMWWFTGEISKKMVRSSRQNDFEKKQLHTQQSTFHSRGRGGGNYAICIIPRNIT